MTLEVIVCHPNPACNAFLQVGALASASVVKQSLTSAPPRMSSTVKPNLTVGCAGNAAAARAETEHDRWHQRAINAPSAVEQHFIEATAKVKKLVADKPAKGKGGAK